MKQQKKLLIYIFLTTSLFANSFELGKKEYMLGNYANAKNSFSLSLKNNPSDLETHFYYGLSSFYLGEYKEAIAAYDRVLILDENHHRARLELGRCYFQLKMYTSATSEFNKVLDSNPPTLVKDNIHKFLKEIRAIEKKLFFYFSGSLGLGYDSNINAKADDEIQLSFTKEAIASISSLEVSEISNSDITIDKAKASGFINGNLSGSYKHDFGKKEGYYSLSSLSSYIQMNENSPENNLFYFKGSTALGFKERNFNFLAPFFIDSLILDGSALLNSYGITPTLSYLLTTDTIINLQTAVKSKRYVPFAKKGYDSDSLEIALGFRQIYKNNSYSLNVSHKKEEKIEKNSYLYVDKKIQTFFLGTTQRFKQYIFYLNGKHSLITYDDTIDTTKREDTKKSWESSVTFPFNKTTQANLYLNYETTDSNYDLGKYKRTLTGVNLIWNWSI